MHPSKTIIWIIVGIAGLVVVLLAFRAGVMVGYHQAEYSDEWEHFHGTPPMRLLNDHGAAGVITAISAVRDATSTVTIHDAHDGVDKIVLVPAGMMNTASSTISLQIGQNIAVIGVPNTQGEIIASIIRLLPPPPSQQ